MLQLIVGGEQARRHAHPQLLQLFLADQFSLVAVVFVDVRHFGKYVFLVPWRAQIDDPPALVPDVLQLVILDLGSFALRAALPVVLVADVVRNDVPGMFPRNGTPDPEPQQLRCAHRGFPKVGAQMARGFARDDQRLMVVSGYKIADNLLSQNLTDHPHHLGYVAVRLPQEDNVPPRAEDQQHRDRHSQAGGFIASPVRLQGIVACAVDHLPDPFPVKVCQVPEADPSS